MRSSASPLAAPTTTAATPPAVTSLAVPVAAALGVIVRYGVRRYQESALYREGAGRAGMPPEPPAAGPNPPSVVPPQASPKSSAIPTRPQRRIVIPRAWCNGHASANPGPVAQAVPRASVPGYLGPYAKKITQPMLFFARENRTTNRYTYSWRYQCL